MKQILAVCDYEAQYVRKLADYLNNHNLVPFEVQAFDDPVKLKLFSQKQTISILLIDECMYQQTIMPLQICETVILLSGDKMAKMDSAFAESMEYGTIPTISKYQSVENMAKQLLQICTINTKIVLPQYRNQNAKKLIGIYSPIKRTLQTSFSLVLGQLLAQNKKCLYVNLEPYSGFHSLLGKQSGQGMEELFYFMQKSSERFLFKMKSIVDRIGELEYIPPADSFLDLMDIQPEGWQYFINTLVEQTDYDIVIFDLSDYIRGLFDFLANCDIIYTITKNDGVAIAKLDQYERVLSHTNHESILNKTKKCQIPVFKELPKQIDKLPYSALAEYVKALIKEDNL